MVKESKNPLITERSLQNSPNPTSKLDSKLSKSRQQIYQENYQKNKERKKQYRRERYQQQKQAVKEQLSKYYQASAIKVLLSLKAYTELNSAKRKIWLDFIGTFKDLNQIGINNIIEIMRLRELAENLINDYWTTAKSEEWQKGKAWDSLDQAQKDRLIKYWSYEKARTENNFLTTAEQLENQSRECLKALELAKFHEERGKIKCPCYACETKKALQTGIKQSWNKELAAYDQRGASEKEKCPGCGKLKVLEEESGVCKTCLETYE